MKHHTHEAHLLRTPPTARRLAHWTLCLAASLAHGALQAQSNERNPSTSSDPYLYQDLGGQAGLKRLVEDFADRLAKHPRSKALFADVKMDRFRDKLTEQLCEVSGGPCRYSGDPMTEVQKGKKLSAADFNVTVELLQASMDTTGLSFRVQNRLLAQLAPLQRDIEGRK